MTPITILPPKGVSQLKIDMDNVNVVLLGGGNRLTLDMPAYMADYHLNEKGVCTITQPKETRKTHSKKTVYISGINKEQLKSITVCSSSNVTIRDLTGSASVKVYTEAGNVNIYNSSLKFLFLKNNRGKIQLANLHSLGNITVKGTGKKYNIKELTARMLHIKVKDSGKLSVSSTKTQDLTIRQVAGNLSIKDATSKMANIKVEGPGNTVIDGRNITSLTASTAGNIDVVLDMENVYAIDHIKGTLPIEGEWPNLNSDTALPQKKLRLQTTQGRVRFCKQI